MNIDWVDEDGKRREDKLENVLSAVHQVTDVPFFRAEMASSRECRESELKYRFQCTYESAIQSGAGIVDAIAKAKDAVKAAGMYDNAMNEAVTDRLNAEFPDDAT